MLPERSEGESHGSPPDRLRRLRARYQRHVCAFFHSQDEAYRVLLPFITKGFERGEKAFHIVDPELREEHLGRLTAAGIDVSATQTTRQFADAYLRDGHFDQDKMLALIEEVLVGGLRQGFPLTRLIAQMEWALEDQERVLLQDAADDDHRMGPHDVNHDRSTKLGEIVRSYDRVP